MRVTNPLRGSKRSLLGPRHRISRIAKTWNTTNCLSFVDAFRTSMQAPWPEVRPLFDGMHDFLPLLSTAVRGRWQIGALPPW
jgi:hypothetical protein